MSEALRVVGAVIEHQGKILACRRLSDKTEGGKWEFPGGKIEPGEHPREALARELREELGLEDIQVLDLVNRETTEGNDGPIDLACFRVAAKSIALSSTDHDKLVWLTPNWLKALNWANADWPTVNVLTSPQRSDS